ncbi:hypothetical protein JTE90_019535, partial [Oedothorax gibbosus]
MEISPTATKNPILRGDLTSTSPKGHPPGGESPYSNIFIGQGTLEDIPEGYTPRHWGYY